MEQNLLRTARVTRLSNICCHMAVTGGAILLVLGAMPVLRFVYWVICGVITLGIVAVWMVTLMLIHPFDIANIVTGLYVGDGIFEYIRKFAMLVSPYMCGAVALLGAISIPLLAYNKSMSLKKRIIVASIGIGMAIIGIILVYVGAGTGI